MYGSMQKYIEVDVQDVALTGQSTSDETGNDKVTDTGAFASGVAVGDILHDTTDDQMYTVTAIDSANTLSLSALGASTGTGVGNSKDFIIYSNTSSSKQLIAGDGVALVENVNDSLNSEVDIQYCGVNGIKIRIQHASAVAGNEDMRDGFQDSMEAALIQAWPLVKYSSWLPSSKILGVAVV